MISFNWVQKQGSLKVTSRNQISTTQTEMAITKFLREELTYYINDAEIFQHNHPFSFNAILVHSASRKISDLRFRMNTSRASFSQQSTAFQEIPSRAVNTAKALPS
ncbi:hypothetical protein [Paraburkholderia silvatlantica]|uniref:hypothetical protein n=1 Tax=Paraburkholderia silvatlantica TaxID=321895 RepID=UPI00105D6672|nr:hypothetical protein [Paraburkholderia silvatlantica]